MKRIFFGLVCMCFVTIVTSCANKETDTISVITREEGSGTRGAFIEITGIFDGDIDNTNLDAIVHDGTGKVMTAVQNYKNALGYISLGSLNDTVKGVPINGVAPTTENIKNGTYKISRPFNIVINQDKSPLTEDFINYILSKQGQDIVNESGFVSIHENSDFKSSLIEGTIIIGGSTSVYPLMEKLAEGYKALNLIATINIEAIGSSAGIKGAIDGRFDIGMASRELKDEEKSAIEYISIASDGIVIIANTENPLDNLTLEQVKEIYEGELTSFSDIN